LEGVKVVGVHDDDVDRDVREVLGDIEAAETRSQDYDPGP
jgi:hypothetical protein